MMEMQIESVVNLEDGRRIGWAPATLPRGVTVDHLRGLAKRRTRTPEGHHLVAVCTPGGKVQLGFELTGRVPFVKRLGAPDPVIGMRVGFEP